VNTDSAPSSNPADEAAIDAAQQLEGQVETNRRVVLRRTADALDDLKALIALTDAQINANPAVQVRTVARAVRMLIRLELDRFEDVT